MTKWFNKHADAVSLDIWLVLIRLLSLPVADARTALLPDLAGVDDEAATGAE